MKRISLLSLLLVIAGSAFAIPTAEFHLPSPQIETLPNGMKVAWFVDDKLPILDLGLLIESGTMRDPRGKSGTVELLSELLERGSNGLSSQQIAQKVESLGASGFAGCDDEAITLGTHGLSEDGDELLQVLSWMALKPNFSPTEFKKEKEKIIESWKHLPDSPESLASYAFSRVILGGTQYGRGSLKDLKEFSNLSLADLKAFHRNHFTPKNAVLMVVGRVNQDAFRKKITEHFGKWKGEAPKKTTVVYQDPKAFISVEKKMEVENREILLVDRPGSPQAQVRLGFRIPGVHSPQRYALSVANAFLGEYFNSRLNLIVRDKLGLAYGIQSSLTYYKDFGFLTIASATASVSTGQLLAETIRQLRLLKASDFLKEEIEISKDYLLGGYPLTVSNLGSVANRWLNGYAFDLGPDYMNEFMPKVSAVTREAVVQAVDEGFHLDQMVIVVSGDSKAIEKSLREKGFKKIKKVSGKSLM